MTFPRCKVALVLVLGVCASLSFPVWAQTDLAAPIPVGPQVPEVGNADLATLSLTGPGAISLRASLAVLRANPNAEVAIKTWVARGNVVFLHSDAAQSFGFATVPLRPTVNGQGGQEFVRTRAALPLGAHPLLRGDGPGSGGNQGGADEAPLQNGDVTRLPGVSRVFGSLGEGDDLVVASDVATPLLQLEDVTGNGNSPAQFAAAITSLGAGWAIFCPDDVDIRRGDGALFARALQGFIPAASGQRWVGVPTRALIGGNLATLAATLEARLNAANASNGTAALPAFGTPTAQMQAPPVSEPTLPLERGEATAFLAVLRTGGVRATARVALMQARLALQNGDADACSAALDVAAADPALSSSVDFWNACLNAQLGADVSLPAPQRASLFDLAGRTFARSAAVSAPTANTTAQGDYTASVPVSTALSRNWSQKMARLAAIQFLSPPIARTLVVGDSNATVRSYPGDGNALAVEAPVNALLRDTQFGWRAPHVEIILAPSPQDFFSLRRALGRADTNYAPDGDQIGNTILLASGGANEATLKRLWSRVLLSTWSDDARPLPAWLQIGIQGVALGGNSPADQNELRRIARTDGLSLFDNSVGNGTTPLSRARSTALVEWLYSNFGVGAVSDFVARLSAGVSPEEAITSATGESLDTLDTDWTRFLGA
ncbi:hypothetical protein IAD21_01852 [Abditibacteriota bacterium]|nr:hypothetical protein IAD21_01852 [Abditibacteriota bacterium]